MTEERREGRVGGRGDHGGLRRLAWVEGIERLRIEDDGVVLAVAAALDGRAEEPHHHAGLRTPVEEIGDGAGDALPPPRLRLLAAALEAFERARQAVERGPVVAERGELPRVVV